MKSEMTDLIKRNDALLPCPFCGGEASKIPDADHSTGWAVGCFTGKCDLEPYVWAVHLETAAMQWNTRALLATNPAAIREAALREAYEVVYQWWFGDGNALPQELILALIGEKK